MKCYKRYHLLSFVLVLVLLLQCPIGIYASEPEPTPTSPVTEYNGTYTVNLVDLFNWYWEGVVTMISKPFAIAKQNFTEAQDYIDWLQGEGLDVLEQYPTATIHSTHPPGADLQQSIAQSESIDIPVPVQNTILQFIQYSIANDPQGYSQCYIHSYNYLDSTNFRYYQAYASTKEVIKNCNGFAFMWVPNGFGTGTQNNMYICTIDKSLFEVNFYGTTLSGIFSNVQLEHNWSNLQSVSTTTQGVKWYMVRMGVGGNIGQGNTPSEAAGSADYDSSYVPNFQSVYNGSGPQLKKCVVMTSLDKDELVYCFDTLNSYKNYNSGTPKDYYLTSEGLENGTWTVTGSGTINTGQMDNSSYYYNNVISNVQTGWTAAQVLELVDRISGSSSSGGSSSGGSDDNTGIWKGIGEAIGSLITGIATVISEVASALSNAILNIINIFVGDDGLFSKLSELVNVGFQNFLTSVFGWMPEQIVTLFTATLIFGIFFAIWKMLRG